MSKRPTPAVVNKALAKVYGDKVVMYRGREGYYYFSGDLGIMDVDSIYQYTLEGYTVEEILKHVADCLDRRGVKV